MNGDTMIDGELDTAAQGQLFTTARTRNAWLDKPVSDDILERLYELAKWGPTAANGNPARFAFVRSAEAKARLQPHLSPGNVAKTMGAPVCVIVAWDSEFYEYMPQLFPSRDMSAAFVGKPDVILDTATRNSTLQGAYIMLAARTLGLDVGPMSGFNKAGVDGEFFPDGRWKSNFLFNLGYGSDVDLFPRNPRLEFAQACQIL
ncbi:MAG: nitroreductase [Rhizorhabdus sp.]|nr:nitroreductase [Rhizorhabdus sp.]